MNLTRTFIENFAHPKGLLGRLVAWRLDITNHQANEWTLSLLDLRSTDHLLEVGFGSGKTLEMVAKKLGDGFIAGVDSSPTMLKVATKRNMRLISNGRMELKQGNMESLPYTGERFDKIFAVQVINYLPDPVIGLKEVFRVLKPGGRMAIFFEAKEKFVRIQSLIDGIYHSYDAGEVEDVLRVAGFYRIRVEKKEFSQRKVKYTGYVALAEKAPHPVNQHAHQAQGEGYELLIKGYLSPDRSEWFEGLSIVEQENGDTLLAGNVKDQAALHGILAKIRDLNLMLISMRQIQII